MHFPPRLDSRFWRLWSAVGISSVGDGMALVAFPLLALTMTRSPLLIAGVVISSRSAALLFALPAGVLADRYNRRKLLIGAELVLFAVSAVFTAALVAGYADLAGLYLTVFVIGGVDTLVDCVVNSALPSMLAPELLVKGVGHLSSVNSTSQDLAGQSLGGLLFGFSRSIPFLGDCLSFLGSAFLISSAVPDAPAESVRTSVRREFREGATWFRKNPVVRYISFFTASMAFCQSAVLALLVIYATGSLHLSHTGYGVLLAFTAFGSFLGPLVARPLEERFGAVPSLCGAGLVAAVCYPALALTHSVVVAWAALSVETISIGVGLVAGRALRQRVVPDRLQGRVGSVHMTIVLAAMPLGSAAGGLFAANMGIRLTFWVAGLLQIALVGLLGAPLWSRLRGARIVDLRSREIQLQPKVPLIGSKPRSATG